MDYEKLLRVSRQLRAIDENLLIGVCVRDKPLDWEDNYLAYVQHTITGRKLYNFNLYDYDIEEIKLLFKTNYIQPKKMCIDLLDTDVYIDKEVQARVKSIHKNYVVVEFSTGDTDALDLDRIWIKE